MIRTFLRAAAFATAKVVPASGGGACGAPSAEIRDQLAPTGKLRVGVYQGSPLSMVRNSSSGEMRGVTHDSGRELARCLGVPFETVVFPRLADVVQAVREGAVDVTLTNATAERAKVADFTPPLVLVEQGYLVMEGSTVSQISDIERAGVRVGVLEGSTSKGLLAGQLKIAEVIAAPALKSALEMLAQRTIDAFATNKAILFELSDGLPGSRVLDGGYGVEKIAMAIPKGRERGLPYLCTFVEYARSSGVVRRAAENAGLRGLVDA